MESIKKKMWPFLVSKMLLSYHLLHFSSMIFLVVCHTKWVSKVKHFIQHNLNFSNMLVKSNVLTLDKPIMGRRLMFSGHSLISLTYDLSVSPLLYIKKNDYEAF